MLSLSQVDHRVSRKRELVLAGSHLLPLSPNLTVESRENLFNCCCRQTSLHPHTADPGRLSRDMIDWCSSQGKESSCNLCYVTGSLGPGPGLSALGDSYLSSEAAAGLFTDL